MNLADNQPRNIAAVVEKSIPEQKLTVKFRANHKYDVALLLKRPVWKFESLATLSAGLGVNNVISDKRKVQWGVQADFNI